MSVPAKRKGTTPRKKIAKVIKTKQLVTCSGCKKKIMPHRACQFCGKYLGSQVVEIKIKKGKTEKQGK